MHKTVFAGHSGEHAFTLRKQTWGMTDTNQFLTALNVTVSDLLLEKQKMPDGYVKRTSVQLHLCEQTCPLFPFLILQMTLAELPRQTAPSRF